MSFKIEVGDIFNAILDKDCVFIHGCNAQGVMGSGVAAIVKKQYPHAYLAYKQAHRRYGLKVGQVIVSPQVLDGPIICNAVTQEFYGRDGKQYASYDGIVIAMQSVAKQFKEKEIHLPMIGGGLGGLDVKRLAAIYQAVFHDNNATLWVVD